jgi:hypothetical protein
MSLMGARCAVWAAEAWDRLAAGRVALSGWLRESAVPQQEVQVDPSAADLPGAEFIQQLLDWAGMAALWGSLGAILAGAAVYGLSYAGVFGAKVGGVGKVLAVGGAVGAVLTGLAAAIVNGLYGAANG